MYLCIPLLTVDKPIKPPLRDISSQNMGLLSSLAKATQMPVDDRLGHSLLHTYIAFNYRLVATK